MTIDINGHHINNIDPLHFLIFLNDKVDKQIINDIAKPDFSIVVKPSGNIRFKKKEGDYDIIIRKDNGEEMMLVMPHRGAKMLFVLTLLCQKAVGGLPNKYFKDKRAATVIKVLYDKLYRSGGDQWVANCEANHHKLSIFRTHAKNTVEEEKALNNMQCYWCGFENEKRTVGKNLLQLRRIRIPNKRIIFEDATNSQVSFAQLIEQLPPLEDLFGFRIVSS